MSEAAAAQVKEPLSLSKAEAITPSPTEGIKQGNEQIKKAPMLSERRIEEAAYGRNSWRIVPVHGTPLEDVLMPGYWVHIAKRLKPGDLIEVDAEDFSSWALLKVRDADDYTANVVVIIRKDFEATKKMVSPADDYTIDFKGPIHKHRVLRNGVVLKEGISTKAEAQKWSIDHQETMRR